MQSIQSRGISVSALLFEIFGESGLELSPKTFGVRFGAPLVVILGSVSEFGVFLEIGLLSYECGAIIGFSIE
jgi:predicted Na+-dependent transporter